jgi:integrase
MSSIYRRKSDNVWVGSVDLLKGADGKRKRKNFTLPADTTEGKAKKILKSKIREVEFLLEHNIYRDPGNATIKDLIREYNEHPKKLAQTTKELYKMYEEIHIIPSIGYLKISNAVPAEFEKFYDKLMGKRKLSPNTIIKIHSFLHGAFRFAVKNRIVLSNPMDSVKCPDKIKYYPRIPNNKEFEKLLAAVKGTFDEVVVVLAGVLTLSRGEIFGLRWDGVDEVNMQISITETFTRFSENIRKDPKAQARKRTMYAPRFVFDLLNRYRVAQKNVGEYVCTKYLPQSYGSHFKKLVDSLGLQGITLHKLRHYNAIIMMNLGIPDKNAAKRTGHSQVATLREVYQHATDEADMIACEKIDGFFRPLMK